MAASVSRLLPLVDGLTVEPLVALAQIVVEATTPLPLEPRARGAAVTHSCRDAAFTVQLGGVPRGTVHLIARWTSHCAHVQTDGQRTQYIQPQSVYEICSRPVHDITVFLKMNNHTLEV